MAKFKGLILCLSLIPVSLSFAAVSDSASLTYTASPEKVTATTSIWDIDDDTLNIKVKELHVNITPSFKFVLPDASVYVGLKQRVGDTVLEGMTEYNYLQNRIKYMLKYGLDIVLPVSVSLYDNLEFEQIYKAQKYIQRTRGMGFSLETPLILSMIKIGEDFNNETSYFAKLDGEYNPEQGIASIFNTWMEIKQTERKAGEDYDTYHFDINFEKAVPHKYSAYNFLFMNIVLTKNFRSDHGNNILFYAETGHMLEGSHVPSWKIYSIGGYDRMIGYGLNEFQDYYKVFTRIKYDRTIVSPLGLEWWWFRLDNLKAFVIGDTGTVASLNKIKYSVGAGVSLQFTFRKRTPVKMTFALGQALENGRLPVVYFIYELL